jgi:hypothetical protein
VSLERDQKLLLVLRTLREPTVPISIGSFQDRALTFGYEIQDKLQIGFA